MTINPYASPATDESPPHRSFLAILAICTISMVRLSLVSCIAFIVARCVTHPPKYWGNIAALVLCICLLLLLTHLIERRKTKNQSDSSKFAMIIYFAGAFATFVVYALDRHVPWFGNFTEL